MRLDLDGFTEAEVLQYVLAGLMGRHAAIAQKITEIWEQLGVARTTPAKTRGRKPTPVAAKANAVKPKRGRPAKVVAKATGKRTLSPEARQRIADAQHRRWAKKPANPGRSKYPSTRGQKVKLAEPDAAPIEEMALAEVG